MLNKRLLRAILAVHFSPADSSKPYYGAILRLIFGCGLAIAFGSFCAKLIAKAILPYGFTNDLIFSLSLSVGFVIGGLVCLVLSSVLQSGNRAGGLVGILCMLSIPRNVRWLCSETPVVMILGIVGLFGGIVIQATAQAMLVSSAIAGFAWLLGLYSGYGCMLLGSFSRRRINVGIYIGVVSLVGVLFDRLLLGLANSHISGQVKLLLVVINSLILLPLIGHVHLYLRSGTGWSSRGNNTQSPLVPNRVPYFGWYLVKLIRNKRTRNSLLVAICLSFSGALAISLRPQAIADPYQFLFFGAVLAATFACDVRGIIKKLCPVEMEVLHGPKSVVKAELFAVFVIGLIIGAPLLVTLIATARGSIVFILVFAAIQTFAVTIGLFASTLLVPGSKDAGSQFMAAALAISGVFLLPKLCRFSGTGHTQQIGYWLLAATIFSVLVYWLEIIRRRGYGRT